MEMTGKQELQYSYQTKQTLKRNKDKEGHYLMIKGSIQGEDVTIINIYAPNIGAPRYIQQLLTDIKGDIDESTIIVDRSYYCDCIPINFSLYVC